ncbi:hypothetical protein BDP67DRAFT_164444 [Colletotrichum lupini]|nr:hypothetical protein BDP67DRAFT_164444 [Colletotrichum lupini]
MRPTGRQWVVYPTFIRSYQHPPFMQQVHQPQEDRTTSSHCISKPIPHNQQKEAHHEIQGAIRGWEKNSRNKQPGSHHQRSSPAKPSHPPWAQQPHRSSCSTQSAPRKQAARRRASRSRSPTRPGRPPSRRRRPRRRPVGAGTGCRSRRRRRP